MTNSAHEGDVSASLALWFAWLGPPILWISHFVAIYLLVEIACKANLLQGRILGLSAIALAVIGLTLAALAGIAYAAMLAYRYWRRRQVRRPGGTEEEPLGEERFAEGHREFMAFAGLLLSGVFLLVTFATAVPVLVLRPCV